MPIPNDKQGAVIPGAAPSVDTLIKVINKINPATADVEVALAAQALALFLQNQLGDLAFESDVPHPKQIRVLTAGNYTLPADASAVLIEASGGGGGSTNDEPNNGDGNTGGNTTVTNSTRGIAITAPGGLGGSRNATTGNDTGNAGGDFIAKAGAAGGAAPSRRYGSEDTQTGVAGHAGGVVTAFFTNIQGSETLTIQYGAGGAGVSSNGARGEPGWVKITVW